MDTLKQQQQRAATKVATHIREDWYRRRKELARLCTESGEPCSSNYLHQIASGRRKARPGLVNAIVEHSEGQLTEQDGIDYWYRT